MRLATKWSRARPAPREASGEIRVFDPIDDAYDAWKAADAAARLIERDVRDTWMRFQRGVSAGPSPSLLREAACLRHEARERLRHAVRLLHDAGCIQPAGAARPKMESGQPA
jgi:hypothetical protein